MLKIIKSLLSEDARKQLKVFAYYCKLGLFWYFFRDLLSRDVVKQAVSISRRKNDPKIKILYLYNIEGWAVHNVGKLWLDGQDNVDARFLRQNTSLEKDRGRFSEIKFEDYDFVWFGYLLQYFEFCKRYSSNIDMDKIIVTIHDPMELFPICSDWKSREMKQEIRDNEPLLKKLKNIVVISEELKARLEDYNIKSCLIPTMSLVPLIEKDKIISKKCGVLSVAGEDLRKNFELLASIKNAVRNDNPKVKFHEKIGTDYLLPLDTYMRLIDNHEIYLCTSFMEGGPLPAMDAMNRGLVVITTPVGQIQEIIDDGKNGFICRTREEFIDKIEFLSNNLCILQKMRIAARDSISQKRNMAVISEKVSGFIRTLEPA